MSSQDDAFEEQKRSYYISNSRSTYSLKAKLIILIINP